MDTVETDSGLLVPAPLTLPGVPTRPTAGAIIDTAWGQAVHDAVFGAGAWITFREGFYVVDVPAGVAANTAMPRFGISGSNYPHPRAVLTPGKLLGFFYAISALPTAGNITIGCRTTGSIAPDTVVIGSGSQTSATVMLASPIGWTTTTSVLQVLYSSAAGLTPTTLDIHCGLIVSHDYQPI